MASPPIGSTQTCTPRAHLLDRSTAISSHSLRTTLQPVRDPRKKSALVFFFFFLCLHDACRGTFCSISFFSACMVSLLHRAAGSFVKPPTYHHGIMSAC